MAAGRQRKPICGMEGENVAAYGRLPSPDPDLSSLYTFKYYDYIYSTFLQIKLDSFYRVFQ